MTDVKYDAELCERLEREARDAAEVRPVCECANAAYRHDACPACRADAWIDDNLRAMADQLAAARAEIERLTDELAKPIDRRPICNDTSPRWFTGHWREWHRGHGCDKDDGVPRSPYAVAEIDSYRAARDKAGQ